MTTGFSDDFPNFWSYDYPEWINQTTDNLLSMGHSSPGSFFYNNSACHINSHIIFNKTEMTPLEFGNNYLFYLISLISIFFIYTISKKNLKIILK